MVKTSGCFQQLRGLVLNSCKILTWQSLQLLEPHLPQLEELYLACNPLYVDKGNGALLQSEIVVTGFSKLRVLDLTETGICDWSTVSSFAALPDLQELRLDSNAFESCQALLTKSPQDFASLAQLTLSSTR